MSKSKSSSKTKTKGKEFCMSRDEFLTSKDTVAIQAEIDGHSIVLPRKEFSTGSLGYFANGPLKLTINGEEQEGNFQFQWIGKNSKDAE